MTDKELMTSMLQDFAKTFWASKGARFGQQMQVKELTHERFEWRESSYASFPSNWTEDTVFLCDTATVEVGGWDGRHLIVSLWGYPLKKDGTYRKNAIRVTYLYTEDQEHG